MSRKMISVKKKEDVSVGKYSCNFLVDKNRNIYVRCKDLENFDIDKSSLRHWVKKNKQNYPYDFESYYINENSQGVKVYNALGICAYLEDTDKPKYFAVLALALLDIFKEDDAVKEKEEK